MEPSASEDTPIQIKGAFALLEPPFHLFFFWHDFPTASSSSSSSTPSTASSLVSALYLIRTNDIAVLI